MDPIRLLIYIVAPIRVCIARGEDEGSCTYSDIGSRRVFSLLDGIFDLALLGLFFPLYFGPPCLFLTCFSAKGV